MGPKIGAVALVAAALCWGSTVVLIKVASRGLNVLGITIIELTAAVILLAGALLIRGKPLPRPSKGIVIAGLLEPGLAYPLINAGLARTSGSHAALLLGAESVFVIAIAAAVLRVMPSRLVIIGSAIAFVGSALLADGGGGSATVNGDLLVLVGAITSAGYVVMAHRLSDDVDPLTFTSYQFFIGWLVTLPVAVTVVLLGHHHPFGTAQPRYVVAGILTGVVGSAMAFGLYNWALGRVSSALAGTSLTLIPVFGIALSAIFLGEDLTLLTGIAGAAVLAGILLTRNGEAEVVNARG
jgi:O-acetylserine/cysteine efflux transporter